MLEVTFINQQDSVMFSEVGLVDSVLQEIWRTEGDDSHAEVNVVFVDDEEIRRLNHEYRHKDEVTDVLSFALEEADPAEPSFVFEGGEGYRYLGDIVISLPRAASQALEFGHSLQREVGYLAAHGMLHLLGYDHEDEEDRALMRCKEEAVMAKTGLHR